MCETKPLVDFVWMKENTSLAGGALVEFWRLGVWDAFDNNKVQIHLLRSTGFLQIKCHYTFKRNEKASFSHEWTSVQLMPSDLFV